MKTSFFVLHQNDPLKPSSMVCPRGNVAPHRQGNGRRLQGIPRTSPRIRGQQFPVQESRVATHMVDITGGGETRRVETNQEQNSPNSMISSSVPNSAAACIKMGDETYIESASSTSKSLEPSVPQHKIDDSSSDELKYQEVLSSTSKAFEPSVTQHNIDDSSPDALKYETILQRNKDILLRGLSLTSPGRSLTLVSGGISICPVHRRLFLFQTSSLTSSYLIVLLVIQDQSVSTRPQSQ